MKHLYLGYIYIYWLKIVCLREFIGIYKIKMTSKVFGTTPFKVIDIVSKKKIFFYIDLILIN